MCKNCTYVLEHIRCKLIRECLHKEVFSWNVLSPPTKPETNISILFKHSPKCWQRSIEMDKFLDNCQVYGYLHGISRVELEALVIQNVNIHKYVDRKAWCPPLSKLISKSHKKIRRTHNGDIVYLRHVHDGYKGPFKPWGMLKQVG